MYYATKYLILFNSIILNDDNSTSVAHLLLKFHRRQFSIIVSYVMTISKSQEFIRHTLIYIFSKPVLSQGQL